MSQSPSRQARRFCARKGHVGKAVPVHDEHTGATVSLAYVCARCGATLEGEPVDGPACPDCDAETTLTEVREGVSVMTISHDDTCPAYRGLT
jgi:rubrerythrin